MFYTNIYPCCFSISEVIQDKNFLNSIIQFYQRSDSGYTKSLVSRTFQDLIYKSIIFQGSYQIERPSRHLLKLKNLLRLFEPCVKLYIHPPKIKKMFSNFLHCSLQVPFVMVHHAEYVMAYHVCNGLPCHCIGPLFVFTKINGKLLTKYTRG